MDSMPVCILCTKWCHTQNLCIYACFGSQFHSKLGPYFDKLGSPLHVMKTRSLYRPHGESGSLFLRLLKGSHPKFQVRYWFAVISASGCEMRRRRLFTGVTPVKKTPSPHLTARSSRVRLFI